MMVVHQIVGLFMILLGFLVKRFPILISGYNTMSAEEREQVDIKGLSSHMRNSLVIIGLLMVLGGWLTRQIGFSIDPAVLMLGIILPGTLYMVIRSQRFMNNTGKSTAKKGTLIGVVVLVVCGILVITLMLSGSSPTQIEVADDKLIITGMYGLDVQVRSVSLIEELPIIKMKTNGFSLGENKRGNFKLEEIGQCKLFLESMDGPFIYITPKDGVPVVINREDRAKTEALYYEMQKLVTN